MKSPQLIGNVGIAFYDTDSEVQVSVERIPAVEMAGVPTLQGYYRVSFSSSMASVYLLINKSQLEMLCDDLDSDSSDFLLEGKV